jgi:hypothetical protein
LKKLRLILFFFFFLFCYQAFVLGQANVTTTNLTAGQRISASGATTVVPSGPIYDTTQLAGATVEARIAACLTALPSTGGVCDTTGETAALGASLTVSGNGRTIILPPDVMALGSGFFITISGDNNTVMCGGGAQTCVLNGAAAGTTNLILVSGNYNTVQDLQIEGGRCGTSPCASSPVLGGAQSENAIDVTGSYNRILHNFVTDAGKHGILIQNGNFNKVLYNTVYRSGAEGILVNGSSATLTAINNEIAGNYVADSNILFVKDGSISVSCSSPCVAPNVNNTDIHDNTVKFKVFGLTICTDNLETSDTGCKEGIQSTDVAYSTNIHDNFVQNSQNEGIVNSGVGGATVNNSCDSCGLLGPGAGAFMFQYSSLASATVGNFTMRGNRATNSSSTTLGYCLSIQDPNTNNMPAPTVNYENIVVEGNTCTGQPGSGITNGLLFSRTSTVDTLNLLNVRYNSNTMSDGVTNPLVLDYNVTHGTVTGRVRVADNGLNASADTAPVPNNVVAFDSNGQPELDSGTTVVAMPTNACRITSDITLSTSPTNICSWSLPAAAKSWAWQCQIPWEVTAGTTPTISVGVNASQTPTGTTNASAEIKTSNTNTATEKTVALSASGAINVLSTTSTLTQSVVFLSSTSGTLLAPATAGTFAVTMTGGGTSFAGVAKAGATCWFY